jgi:Phage tail protein
MSQMAADCAFVDDMTVTLRDVTIHHTDPPYVLLDFNPWEHTIRADSQTDRAFFNGAWSGAEFMSPITIPVVFAIKDPDGRTGTHIWLDHWFPLVEAWRESDTDIPLEFTAGTGSSERDFLMFGRPRVVQPSGYRTTVFGHTITTATFEALDPNVYAGGFDIRPVGTPGLHEVTTGLPLDVGGLSVPFNVPFTIPAQFASGVLTLVNLGTRATNLLIRIDGPVDQPGFVLTDPDGTTHIWQYHGNVQNNQFLHIDTRRRTVTLNNTASRRGLASGAFPLLQSGTSQLRFIAPTFNADARITATWRDAWV